MLNFWFLKNRSIALTKLDILDDMKEIKIGIAYKDKISGEILTKYPAAEADSERIEVIEF